MDMARDSNVDSGYSGVMQVNAGDQDTENSYDTNVDGFFDAKPKVDDKNTKKLYDPLLNESGWNSAPFVPVFSHCDPFKTGTLGPILGIRGSKETLSVFHILNSRPLDLEFTFVGVLISKIERTSVQVFFFIIISPHEKPSYSCSRTHIHTPHTHTHKKTHT